MGKCYVVFLGAKGCAMPCREKCTLDKLCSSMSDSAVGHEFNINESTIHAN